MSDKILIVEDDAILAVHLKKMITAMGFETLGYVASGEEALRFALDLPPDLILMDIRLKGNMTGIEAATKINQTLNIPIVFLTAFTDQTVLSQIKTSSSYGYLSKPVRDTELKASIDIAIYKNRTDKALKSLNEILKASREINRLITTEKDSQKIFSRACEILVSSKEYECVCFAKFNTKSSLDYISYARNCESKSELTAQTLLNLLSSEKSFIQDASEEKNFFFTFDDDNPQKIFSVKSNQSNSVGVVVPLIHRTINFGFLIIVNKNRPLDSEENELIKEISDDISFALWSIEEEQKRKKAEEEIIILSEVVKQSPAIIIITDLEGKIKYVNPEFTNVTGYTFEESVGQNPRILKSGERTGLDYKEFWDTISSGDPWKGEFKNKKKNGELYWASSAVSPIKNTAGEKTHYLAIMQDITSRKELELELNRALERTREVSNLKSNLIGNLNHEVRTPMNAIIGFAQILKEEIKDEALSDMAEKISRSSYRLLNTLSMIIDLSELESDKVNVNRTKIVLSNFVRYILSTHKIAAKEKNLSFNYKIENEYLIASVDERLLAQVLKNVVDNALKYTETGGITIEIKEGIDPKGIPLAMIKIIDSGDGIPKDSLKVIFEEFRQASEGIRRKYQGTGLGLTIAQKMVSLLQGKIEVESIVGKGSTFTICLPLEIENQNVSELIEPAYKSIKANLLVSNIKPTIFVVEDNMLNVEVLKHFLKDICRMNYAITAKAGMEKISANKFDILLMDIKLGQGTSGIELMKEVRKLPQYKLTPIVAITGYTESEDQTNFIKLGFSHYLAKPFTKKQIVDLIQTIVHS